MIILKCAYSKDEIKNSVVYIISKPTPFNNNRRVFPVTYTDRSSGRVSDNCEFASVVTWPQLLYHTLYKSLYGSMNRIAYAIN